MDREGVTVLVKKLIEQIPPYLPVEELPCFPREISHPFFTASAKFPPPWLHLEADLNSSTC